MHLATDSQQVIIFEPIGIYLRRIASIRDCPVPVRPRPILVGIAMLFRDVGGVDVNLRRRFDIQTGTPFKARK